MVIFQKYYETKNPDFIRFDILFLFSCKKDIKTVDPVKVTNDMATKPSYSRVDTTTLHSYSASKKDGAVRSLATSSASASGDLSYANVTYQGNGNYQINTGVTLTGKAFVSSSYILYKNGAAYESEGAFSSNNITVVRNLPPGIYYFIISVVISGPSTLTYSTPSFTIVAQPTPPAGMIGLYEYYNAVSNQHVCTSDWEELGSLSQNFVFSRTLGYMYPTSGAIAGLKPIYRYLDNINGAHYTTDQNGTFTDYVYEKILGYVSISPTTNMPNALTKWYSTVIQDHYVCIPPVVPLVNSANFVQDKVDFIFGYVQ